MTMNTSQIGGTESTHIPLGAKLQTAREAMRMDRKEAAAQLRLNESVVDMMENNTFPDSMPQIFIRGYMRAYGKLLQMPEDMIQAGLEPVKPRIITQEAQLAMPVTQTKSRRNRGVVMKGITTAVAITLIWLMAAWWNNRANAPMIDNVAVSIPAETVAADTVAVPATPSTTDSLSNADAMDQATIAIAPNLNTKPAASTLPAGISIAQPMQHLSQPTQAYTPTINETSTPAASEQPIAAKPNTTTQVSIPAYKRAAMATNHSSETTRDSSEE